MNFLDTTRYSFHWRSAESNNEQKAQKKVQKLLRRCQK